MFVELMVFGVLSLLMGHWSIFVAKICIRSSLFSTKFFPCIPETTSNLTMAPVQHIVVSNSSKGAHQSTNQDVAYFYARHRYCAKVIVHFLKTESLFHLLLSIKCC